MQGFPKVAMNMCVALKFSLTFPLCLRNTSVLHTEKINADFENASRKRQSVGRGAKWDAANS